MQDSDRRLDGKANTQFLSGRLIAQPGSGNEMADACPLRGSEGSANSGASLIGVTCNEGCGVGL